MSCPDAPPAVRPDIQRPLCPALVLSLAQRTRTRSRQLARLAMRRGCSEILVPSQARRHAKPRTDRLLVTSCAPTRDGPVVTLQPAPRSSATPLLWLAATPSLWPLATPSAWPFARPFGWPFARRKRGHCQIFSSAQKLDQVAENTHGSGWVRILLSTRRAWQRKWQRKWPPK